jgi:hypothetical protein
VVPLHTMDEFPFFHAPPRNRASFRATKEIEGITNHDHCVEAT